MHKSTRILMSICLSIFVLFISLEANAQTITHITSDKGDFEDINPDKSLGNPLHLPIFAPDPSAHVWPDGKLYVYPSRDTPGEGFYGMESWYVFSSENLKDWTNHGLIYHVDDIPWADYKAWAPDCAYKDGKYYFYFPVQDYDNLNWVGVATSDFPTGPFNNPAKLVRGVDPHVFTDYEDNYWFCMNNSIQKLGDDMISLEEERYGWGEFTDGFPDYEGYSHEGTWIFKRNGLYYLTTASSAPEPRADGDTRKHVMIYGTSTSPTGPYTYQGILMNTIGNPYGTYLGNIHGSVLKYKGKWLLFYHKLFEGPNGEVKRAMCIDEINFNEDGTIQEVIPTDEGVDFSNLPALHELDLTFEVSLKIAESGPDEVHFTYSSFNEIDPDSSAWDFGDGFTSFDRFDQGAVHQYENLGEYNVTLTIWLNGEEKEISKTINFTGSSVFAQPPILTECPEWAGYWLNVFNAEPTQEELGDLTDAITGLTSKPKWSDMESADGQYNFYDRFGKRIEDAYNNDEYYYCEMWLGHLGIPDWIFEAPHNVPEPQAGYPDYTDPAYLSLSERFYNELAAYIASLPQEWIDRIAFIQPGFGSTGDRQLYKTGNDAVTSDDYLMVMQTQTNAFINAFQSHLETKNIRFLWNIGEYDGTNPEVLEGKTSQRLGEELYAGWLRNETGQGQLRKQQFVIAIGYQVPGELSQDNSQRGDFFGTSGRWDGNSEFVRGEFNDQKFNQQPLALVNPGLNYYWTAISSVDKGLDAWEGKLNHWNFLGENYPSHKPAMVEAAAFSSRYSYRKNPVSSPYAFIALRDGLDYGADRFSGYGSYDSQKVSAILAEFAPYGAKNDDNNSALVDGGYSYLMNANGLNDCVKNIISRNYSRFISQVDANSTSAGYWRVGLENQGEGHHYGRFARGFDVEKGKNSMYFDVEDEYFEANRAEDGDKTLKIKVIYYASDEGSWELKYHAQDGTMKTALSVTNSGSGWQTAEVTVVDALLDNGDPIKDADLVLENTGDTNCRFHMIELERDPDGKMINVSDVSIENCPPSELTLGVKHQLKATVLPADATDKRVSWSSSNPGIATVDDSGLVTALAEGTTKIKVITNNGELADSCTIGVKKDINILFIGNSFTFRHNLEQIVKNVFAEGNPDLTVNVQRQVHGGQSLFQHTEYCFTQTFIEQSTITDSEIEARIQEMENILALYAPPADPPAEYVHFYENLWGTSVPDFNTTVVQNAINRHNDLLVDNPEIKWDYVVLQSYKDVIADQDDGYAKYAKILGDIAKEQGAEVILYITAPDVQNQASVTEPLNQENVQQEVNTIVQLAREMNPYAVIHVPMAINMIQQSGTDMTFRYENDFHPNQRTAYLTSNMFYAAFFGESTEGFNYDTVTETKTTESGGELLDPDGGPATVVFEGEEKTYLQQMAFNATSLFNERWKGHVSVTGVSIENEPVDGIPHGNTYQLNTEILPLYASDKSVSWSSSDPLIATVDSAGLVSALNIGSVTITVTTNDGGFTDSYDLLVTSQGDQTPYNGIKQVIPGVVECENYDEGGQGVAFYDVDESRLTNFRDPDEVDIRWRTQASSNRFVGLTAEGEWLEYTVDVTPGDYDITLYYFCQEDNSTEIEVSLDGNKIAIFTGMTNKGNLDVRDSVIVRRVSLTGGNDQILRLEFTVGGDVDVDALAFTPAAEYVAVTGVEISNCPSAFLEAGETHQLSASITPGDATDTSVSWSTSNSAVVTVDVSGLVTAVAAGTADITVTAEDGGYTDECILNVAKPVISVSGVSIADCPFAVQQAGDAFQLTASVSPGDATDKSVSWSSSNSSVASVDSTGFVTTHSIGNAFIRVTTNDVGFYDECVVLVDDTVRTDVAVVERPEGDIWIYPNPVTESLNIEVTGNSLIKEIVIFNNVGKLICKRISNSKAISINTKSLNAENFIFIQVVTENHTSHHKVFIL